MGFLLLGTDSLIACIAIGPLVGRRIALPLASYSRWAAAKDPESSRARWAVWILPWALSVATLAAAGAMLAFPSAF